MDVLFMRHRNRAPPKYYAIDPMNWAKLFSDAR